ncbi:MAG: V-type ATP synthase subunit E family protein [Pseudoflavonifractor sp.]
MNGIEKITGQITADAQAEIDAINADARAQGAEYAADCAAKAQADGAEIRRRGAVNAAQREERLASVAGLEARKSLLGAKQEMVTKAFDRALDRLCALPDEEYIALLASLAVKAARTGREQVIFSQKDRNRVGKAVVTRANELLAQAVAPKLPEEITDTRAGAMLARAVSGASALLAGTGMLTLAEGTRPMKGGIVLSDGEVETNCSFEVLVRLQKDSLTGEVVKTLFG